MKSSYDCMEKKERERERERENPLLSTVDIKVDCTR